jgi:putative SOS response-associated peptidase YedK
MCSVKAQTELKFKNRRTSKIASNTLEQRIIKDQQPFIPNVNIWIGMQAYVITDKEPQHYQQMVFGLTPNWAQKKMYLFNARVEGKLNPENNVNYDEEMGIFAMPSFRNAIQNRRCIIPVDYFIEGPEKEKLSKPFLIRRKDKEASILAGIWEEWTDKSTGEILKTYAILTTAASNLLQTIQHHRSPLILNDEEIDTWLDSKSSTQDIRKILYPHDFSNAEALAIDPIIKSKVNDPEVIRFI